MGLVNHTIRSLINGVSRQSPAIRLDNQVEEQVNMIPDLTLGLTRRNSVILENTKVNENMFEYGHEDAVFKYTMDEHPVLIGVKSDGTVYRFDSNGDEMPLLQEQEVKDYLSYTDKNDIVMLETSESVFLLNRNVKTDIDLSDYVASLCYRDLGKNLETGMSDYEPFTNAICIKFHSRGDFSDNTELSDKFFVKNDDGKWMIYNVYSDTSIGGADTAFFTGHSYGVTHKLQAGTYAGHDSTYCILETDLLKTYKPNDVVSLPEVYEEDGVSIRIDKGTGSDPSRVKLYIFGGYRVDEDLDASLYGAWNDDGDTLHDIEGNLTLDFLGISAVATTRNADGAGRNYSITIKVKSNKESPLQALPVRYGLSNFDCGNKRHNRWQILPKGVSMEDNAFIYDRDYNYISVKQDGSDVKVAYYCRYNDCNESRIYENTTIDEVTLENITYINSDGFKCRVIVGNYVELRAGYQQYSLILQKYKDDTIRVEGYIDVDDIFDKGDTIEVASMNAALDLKYIYQDNIVLRRGDFASTVDTIWGDVLIYNFYSKTINMGNPRILTWITTATEGVVYTLTLYTQANDGSITEVLHKGVVASASDTPKDINHNLLLEFTSANPDEYIDFGETRDKNNTTVWITKKPNLIMKLDTDIGSDFGYTVTEANINNTSAIQLVEELPSVLPELDGELTIRINPDVSNSESNYYLKFNPVNGSWEETAITDIESLDALKMPMVIHKQNTNTLIIKPNDWILPPAGDNKSNKQPSFVGKKISDMILFNSRIGFSAEDTLTFSQIDDFNNLYRTTTAKVLVSDRVDLKLDSSRLGYKKIENIFNMGGKIFINTGETQSVLSLPTDLDLTKSAFNQVSSHSLGDGHPVPMRQTMIFPVYSNGYSHISNFTPDSSGGYADVNITRHCEKYIKGHITQMLYMGGLILIRTDNDRNTVYVQHSYIKDSTLVQNAWHKWKFAYPVKFLYTIGSNLHFVFEDSANDRSYFCMMVTIPDVITEDTEEQIGYKPYLDFYTDDEALAVPNSVRVNKVSGKIESEDSDDCVYGIPFESKVTLSEIVARTQDQSGIEKMGFSTLMLRRMVLNLGYTGRLNITISRTDRPDYVHNYIPKVLGDIIIGREEVSDESCRFPVNGRSDNTMVSISTGYNFIPFSISSIEWQGQLINRGGRL